MKNTLGKYSHYVGNGKCPEDDPCDIGIDREIEKVEGLSDLEYVQLLLAHSHDAASRVNEPKKPMWFFLFAAWSGSVVLIGLAFFLYIWPGLQNIPILTHLFGGDQSDNVSREDLLPHISIFVSFAIFLAAATFSLIAAHDRWVARFAARNVAFRLEAYRVIREMRAQSVPQPQPAAPTRRTFIFDSFR